MNMHSDFYEELPDARPHDEIVVPPQVIYLTIALIVFTIVAVSIGHALDIGTTHEGRLAERRMVAFRFAAPPIGQPAIPIVARTGDGRSIVLAGRNEEIFPRLILRSLANIRMRDGVDPNAPVELIETEDGQRLIVDPSTRRTVRLAAFGPVNQAMFDPVFAGKAS